MYDNEKIYSIELGEDLALPDPPREQRTVASIAKPAVRSASRPRKPQPARESKPPSSELQFAPLVILSYLLGPFSVHLNPECRGRKGLLGAGLISGMAGLGMFAGRGFILDLLGNGWPLWPWALVGTAVMVTVFSVWARSLMLVVTHHRQPRHRLPALLRRPWAVGVVGLVAPGLGLLLAGCARRGAAVIWMCSGVVAGVMVLAGGPGIWAGNQAGRSGSLNPVVLESIFLLAAGILMAGLIGWIAQALEGARQMMEEPSIRHRMRGDWYAGALLVTLIGMAMVWDPAAMAVHLDDGSVVLREQGFRLIPLKLSQSAHRLDPAPSQYAIGAMELCEELGRTAEAAELRRELDGNLASYLALVQAEKPGPVLPANTGRTGFQEWKIMAELWEQAGPQGGSRPGYQAR